MRTDQWVWKGSCSLIICLVLLTGCWSKKEINTRSFVTSLYIDKSDRPGEVEVTISTPLPNRLISGESSGAGNNTGNPYAVLSKSGKTIPDAINAIQLDLTREISWGHTRVVVIGHDYAEQGIIDLLAWAAREPLFHLSSKIMVASGKAKDLTTLTAVTEKSPSEVLKQLSSQGKLMDTDFKTFIMSVLDQQDDAVPQLVMGKESLISEKGKQGNWAGIREAAIFSNRKMVGSLSLDQARAVAWAASKLRQADFSVKKNHDKVSATIRKLESKITPKLTRRGLVFNITLKGNGEINLISPVSKVYDPKKTQDIVNAIENRIKDDLTEAIELSMDKQADILHLGSYLEWRYPQLWSQLKPNWREYYHTRLKYQIKTDIKMNYFGSEIGGPS
ncbi:hypothetical protein BK138_35080 [Paenibacillus rhizosphaerae]|uniref:Uncharacterized protein n=1 Tax=Paenibacillus rhizosphaerae TaxID=297318 RepID=A0A1R1DWU0_9BACL|nr:Ger(x)C family spore germination protein [Paenibacillus rhizosphaerae]OMF43988.1 hypothetical protein BK138_35080 [Paenibacillus rhizosphaerae]